MVARTGKDGGRGPSWTYRRHEETETISSSSRSGTIVSISTAYTSRSSRLSSGFSMEEAALMELELDRRLGTPEPEPDKVEAEFDLELEDLELRLGTPEPDKVDAEFAQPIKKPRKETEETSKEMRMKRIESLVQEFFRGRGGSGMSALERWFLELDVSWVLQLDDVGASTLMRLSPKVGIWIQALTQIMETFHLTFFSDYGHYGHGSVGMTGPQFALFFQKAMAKMLVFVDVLVSESICIDEWWYELEGTSSAFLKSCLKVNRALSEVLLGMRLHFHSSLLAEVEKIEKEMVSLLSAKQGKAFDAIRSSMEERRTCILKWMEDSLAAETPQGSSDIHPATWSVMDHIKLLVYDCGEGDPLFVSQAASLVKYVPQTGLEDAQPFISMIAEMVSCLEEKLITKSQSFLDKGLSLLFLLNNSNFIREQLQDNLSYIKVDLATVISSITCKVEHYTQSYIQVSWEPVLACLFNPTPLRLVRKYSPLSKFKSEFQETYNTQKLWKVPDPELRKRLRKAVIQKIIPEYTRFIEDSKVTNPKFTPQEVEEMLQELFEG